MLTLLISLSVSLLAAIGLYFITYNYIWSLMLMVVIILGLNFFIGRYFLKKLTAVFQEIEKDLKNNRFEKAINRLKNAYAFSKWQFFVKEQINSQIGIILYMQKKFDDAKSYLEKGFAKNWMGMAMLATLYFKEKKYEKVKSTMDKAIKNAPKEGFLYSLYAYFLTEMGEKDKAIEILVKGSKKAPLDEKLETNLEALRNGKKMKMKNYGTLWLQLNIEKMPQGFKPYQMVLARQKIRRR
ncbi:tetratricopeptide repeat protein [Deferribacter abyssi]|uniref:tetratricopeptide repeat protein n=1 Tax=Deferribacter abyssi TaxID=213806 RepID=UPI003C1923EE